MSDLEKREQETGNPTAQNSSDSEMITLTDEELEYIREMEQEEEDILSGKRTVKGLDSSEKENTQKSTSAARTDRADGARRTTKQRTSRLLLRRIWRWISPERLLN